VTGRTALLVGATGLVGSECLQLLLGDPSYNRVIVLTRKPVSVGGPRLMQIVSSFDRMGDHAAELTASDVYCCLGTTIAKAGSQKAFEEVDVTYPQRLASITSANGARQFLLVSSLGAESSSRVFYLRMKAKAEDAVSRCPFAGVQIFRPSMLTGKRREFRLGEAVARPFLPAASLFLAGRWKRYRPIAARVVAAAMVRVAHQAPAGVNIFESGQIRALGSESGVNKEASW
jgi:uncharacterized protein YbjT (DUF2867 family)